MNVRLPIAAVLVLALCAALLPAQPKVIRPGKHPTSKPATAPDQPDQPEPNVRIIGPDGKPLDPDSPMAKLIREAATRPSTRISTTRISPVLPGMAKVAPEAKLTLDRVKKAYGQLQSLQLAGQISGEFDVAGNKQAQKEQFTSAWAAPNRFRLEMGSAMTLGSTGKQAYALDKSTQRFVTRDAPTTRASVARLPEPHKTILALFSTPGSPSPDPSLSLAITSDASAELMAMASEINKAPDTSIDGAQCPTLEVTPKAMPAKLLLAFDPQTHLLRRLTADLKPALDKVSTPDANVAKVIIDYTTVKADAELAEDHFNWTAPAGAKPADSVTTQPSGPAEDGE